jgi:hypothetical protein
MRLADSQTTLKNATRLGGFSQGGIERRQYSCVVQQPLLSLRSKSLLTHHPHRQAQGQNYAKSRAGTVLPDAAERLIATS